MSKIPFLTAGVADPDPDGTEYLFAQVPIVFVKKATKHTHAVSGSRSALWKISWIQTRMGDADSDTESKKT